MRLSIVVLFALTLTGAVGASLRSAGWPADPRISVIASVDENDHCEPAQITPNDVAGCTRPLVGCICVASGSGTVVTFGDCEGCLFNVVGDVNCSFSSQPPSSSSFSCLSQTGCNTESACGTRCPCNGMAWYPLTLTCGPCTQF